MYRMTCLVAGLLASLGALAQDTAQHVVPGRSNSAAQEKKPYVIMISIDGCRYDYIDKYGAVNLQRLSAKGIRAASMQPSFPSLTFPNHYTLVTGLYPSHHGLVDNSFYDRQRNQVYKINDRKAVQDSSWYHGNPLWVLAEKQQMVSASYFWVGSESNIQDAAPTYSFTYNEKVSIDRRIQQVVEWLQLPEDKRPHLITFYFPEVDHAGHFTGPESDSTRNQVRFVDASIGKMAAAVAKLKLPVNFIVVSDHGMIAADTAHRIMTDDFYKGDSLLALPSAQKLMYYGTNKQQLDSLYNSLKAHENHYTVYRKMQTPMRWHYGQDDRYNRIGDIVALADAGYIFGDSKVRYGVIGNHGYDNRTPEMQAIFMAWGPAFKSGLKIPAFANVNVYPLVAYILGLSIPEAVDGRLEVLQPALKK